MKRRGRQVEVDDVDKSYRRGTTRVEVLRRVCLAAESGEFIALMGPSGSGKSTLLNLIGGLDRPDAGSVKVCGQRLDDLSERRLAIWRAGHVGFVFQFYHLLPSLSAARNVELPLLVAPLTRRERARRVDAALALTGLEERGPHLPRELSGGEQQRVGIARAIVADPALLLCDEPTGDLDRETGDGVVALLSALAVDHAKTVLMATHDPRAAGRADRVVDLADGSLENRVHR